LAHQLACSSTPSTVCHATNLHFVGALAAKSFKEIEETIKNIYSNKALKKMQLYKTVRKVKEGKLAADQSLFNGKRKVRNPGFITISSPTSTEQLVHCD
jgi:hypothetical protein